MDMTHAELPLPDYDQLSIGDLRHRIRSLEAEQLRAVADHERAHANRVPVLEILDARLADLAAGAEPAPGDPSRAPGVTGSPGGSPVQPTTAAESNTPLRHGMAEQTPSRGRP
jgi:hypothetical protein